MNLMSCKENKILIILDRNSEVTNSKAYYAIVQEKIFYCQ